MPQSATSTPFSVLSLAILHFVVLGHSPETKENLRKMFKISKLNSYLLNRK